MAIMNVAPKALPANPKGMVQPSANALAGPATPAKATAKKKTRGNIGRMLREKL